jgi:hypothetical protein
MMAKLKEAWANEDAKDVPPNLEEKYFALLQVLLTLLRRARETPLQFGIDSDGIVTAALREFLSQAPQTRSGPNQNWPLVTAALDRLLVRSLGGNTHQPFAAPVTKGCRVLSAPDAQSFEEPVPHPLAVWLERLFAILSEIQPRAVEIVALRVEGFEDRDLAERLGLGLRLVRRIVADVRTNWSVAAGAPPAVEAGILPGGDCVPISSGPDKSSPSPGGRMPPSTAGGAHAATG